MTTMLESRTDPPSIVGDRMAGPKTRLIRNCWYVAAWSTEIGRTLLSRCILGADSNASRPGIPI